MAVIYTATLRTARMQQVLTAIAGGTLQIGTAGMGTILANIVLDDPAGAVSGDTLTFTVPRSDNAAPAGGTAAEARIRNSGGVDQITGLTVGVSGANVNIASGTTIEAGQVVTMTSGSLTHNTSG